MYTQDFPALSNSGPMTLAIPLIPQQYGYSSLSLTQLLSILWARRKSTLSIATAVVLAVALACVWWPRTYQATATLMVNFDVNDPLGGKEFPVGLLGSYMATQVELAQGSEVLLAVIDRLKLADNKTYAAGYRGNATGLRDWIEARMRKDLLVEQGRYGSQLIYVTYSAQQSADAALIANTIAEVYSEQQHMRLTGPASSRAQRYTEQLGELKDKVNRAQDQVADFRKHNGLIGSDAKADVDMHSTMIQLLKPQLAIQTSQLAELNKSLGWQHPQVTALQAQISATRQALGAEQSAYSSKAGNELAAAKYQLELESAQSVYKRALDGYDQVMFASTGSYTNLNFVSRATPPPKAKKPNVNVILLLACLLGLALGLVIPLSYELLHRRVRCRDDIERELGIPVLVELGSIAPALKRFARGIA